MAAPKFSKDEVLAAIYAAVDEVNETLPTDRQLARSADTVLFGSAGSLDSFALVNLVISTEQQFLDRLDVGLTLASEQAMSRRNSPFRSIDTLADYAMELIAEGSNGQ